MSLFGSIRVGEVVPIFIQLDDGNTSQFPQVEIRNPSDLLLQTVDLSHVANGLYVPDSPFLMPDEPFIRVSGIIYSDSGRTTENTSFSRIASSYAKKIDATQASVDGLNDLAQADVQTALDSQGYTTPRASNLDNLDASVSSRESEANASSRATTNQTEHDSTQSLISGLSKPGAVNIDGVILQQSLIGDIEQQEIVGEITQ